jgi:ribosome-associated protein
MAKKKKPVIEEDIIYVSKSELKRDAQQYQQLALDLASMAKKQRDKLPLSDDLLEAMIVADKIRAKSEAYRRHINYITKTLRTTDNIAEIEAAIGLMLNKNNQADVLLNKIEIIRDELIQQGDDKVNELLGEYPELERQKMRQLVRQAKKEATAEKPAKGFKELFQYLKEAMMP